MDRSFSLSLAAVDILSQLLQINLRQFPFEIPSVGQYLSDRERIARAVFTDLAGRGLVRNGRLVPELEEALRTLSDYVIAVAVMGTVSKNKEIYARASAAGEVGVLAVKEGQSLRLELIRPTALAIALVGLLPRVEAGPGQSVTITRPAKMAGKAAETADGSLFTQVRAPQRGSEQQMRIAASYLNRPRTGTGFFAVTGRDKFGREVRAGGLNWLDTDQGRYLSLSRPPDETGAINCTFSPADSNRLTQQLGEMIESVAPRR